VFGPHINDLPISSTKSLVGHCLNAAGAVELAVTALALQHGVLPPTAGYRAPDPDCAIDCVPNEARAAPIRVAMSNSFAFGGLNAVLLLKHA
jgi:nodulation protein E